MRLLRSGASALALFTATHAAVLQHLTDGSAAQNPIPHLPWAGNGTCLPATLDSASGLTTVRCLGPRHPLHAGQTIDVLMLLETPYPRNETVVVLSQTAQLVDDDMRPVPLSEVYVHHYVSSYLFLLGNGAELRGSFTRKPLPEPYALVVNGSFVADVRQRLTNIQLINTVGLPLEQAKPCLECWCDHPFQAPLQSTNLTAHPRSEIDKGDPTFKDERPDSQTGSLRCCHQCPSTLQNAPVRGYHLQYNVTYKPVKETDFVNRTDLIGFDVTGGKFEYQIPHAMGPGSTHVQSYDTVYDKTCPQKHAVDVLRCTAHQHFGGQCVELINLDKDELICRSCPLFGSNGSQPGDESGYVVKIQDDDLTPPYHIEPGTNVRIQSKYDASVSRFGVMGLLSTWAAGLPEPCYVPAANNSDDASASGTYSTPLYNHMGIALQHAEPAAGAVLVS